MKRIQYYIPLWLFAAALLLYLVIQAPLYWNQSFTLDEETYVEHVRNRNPDTSLGSGAHAFLEGNHLGYGSFYWGFYAMVAYWKPASALFTMRILCLLMTAAVPCFLFRLGIHRKSDHSLIAALVWLILPVAWWSGKVTGPEILSLFLAMVGLYLLCSQKYTQHAGYGFLLLGMACGTKLNVLPIAAFALCLSLWKEGWLRRTLLSVGGFVLGFMVANPFFLIRPKAFFMELANHTMPPDRSWKFMSHAFSNDGWEWDGVLSGGLIQWTFPVTGWVVLFAIWLLLRIEWRFLIGFLVAAGGYVGMFLMNGRFLGWYWFPLILLVPLSFLYLQRQIKYSLISGGISLLIFSYFTMPLNAVQYNSALERIRNWSNSGSVQACLAGRIRSEPDVQLLVDYGEPALHFDISAIAPQVPSVISGLNSWIWLNGHKAVPGTTLFLFSDRIASHFWFREPIGVFTDIMKSNGHGEIRELEKCGFVRVVRLR